MSDEEVDKLIKTSLAVSGPNTNPAKPSLSKFKEETEQYICKYYILFSIFFIACLFIILIYGYELTLHEDPYSKLIEKSVLDNRQYKYFQLNNDMNVIIISDPYTTNSKISLELRVGYNAENGLIPGLSHLLAHLILTSSKKYEKYHFEMFLKEKNGIGNLLIDEESTNFFFEINNFFFVNALDIFIEHIREPKFEKIELNELIDEIDKEFDDFINIEKNKITHLIQLLTNPNHIFSNFFPGNKESLQKKLQENNIDLYKEIQWYYNEYYSGNLMNLVVLTNYSIEPIEKIIKDRFLHIKNNRMPLRNISMYPKPFNFENTGKLITFLNDNEDIELYVVFPIQIDESSHNEILFISEFFNFKGNNSLFDLLKKKEIIYDVESSIFFESSDFILFETKFIIPKKKSNQIIDLLNIFFSFKELIREQYINKNNYEYFKNLTNILFKYSEINDSIEELQKIAKNLGFYKISNILNGDNYYSEFNENKIKKFLTLMNPANSFILISNNGFQIENNFISNSTNYENNDNLNHLIRFSDFNSLKESLKMIRNKKNNKNNKKFLNLINNDFEYNEKFINENDFLNIFNDILNSYDKNYKLYYKMSSLSSNVIMNLSFLNGSFLNETINFEIKTINFTNVNISNYIICQESISNNNTNNNNSYHSIQLNSSEHQKYNICLKKFEEKNQIYLNLTQGKKINFINKTSNFVSFNLYYNFMEKIGPKFSFFLQFKYNLNEITPKYIIIIEILSELIENKIKSNNNGIIIADYLIEVKRVNMGIELKISGLKINELENIINIIKEFFNYDIIHNDFFILKKEKFKLYKQEIYDSPLIKSRKVFEKIIDNNYLLYEEKIFELQNIELDDMKKFIDDYHKLIILKQIMIIGNLLETDMNIIVNETMNIYDEFLNSSIKQNNISQNFSITQEILQLNKSKINFVLNETKKDFFSNHNLLIYYFQYGEREKNNYNLMILSEYIQNNLLKYIENNTLFTFNKIFIIPHSVYSIDGILLFIEYSHSIHLNCIKFIIENFFQKNEFLISNLTNSDFLSYKINVKREFIKRNENFKQKSIRIWNNLINFNIFDTKNFSKHEKIIDNITKEEIIDFYNKNFIKKNNFFIMEISDHYSQTIYNESSYHNISNIDYFCGIKSVEYPHNSSFEFRQTSFKENMNERLSKNQEITISNITELKNYEKYKFYF